MRIYRFVGCCMLILLGFNGLAQELEDEKYSIIEERVDFLLDINEGGEADFTTLFEQLEFYYDKPLNLNKASKDELLNLGLLNEIQINDLLNHLEKSGNLIAFEELQSIRSFDLESILLIQPFTKVSANQDIKELDFSQIFREGNSQLFIRYSRILEDQAGYIETAESKGQQYLGSQDKLFTRYRFQYANKLSFGFTAEKDAGEEFFKGSQPNGFDFYSAHLFAQDLGYIKQIAIGDYQAQFGQGLTFWSGLAFGRSPNIFTLKRNAPSLRPYTSVQESLFLRGSGVTLAVDNFELTLFYSKNRIDANLDGRDTLTNEIIVTSLNESGFHRTLSELEDKNAIQSQYLGGHLAYVKRNLNVGVTAVNNQLTAQLNQRSSAYNQFSRLDNNNTNLGLDYSYLFKNINFFGELSKSIDGGIAHTNGILAVLDPRLSLALQHRSFDRNFLPIQSNAIAESAANTNEQGTFLGIDFKISRFFTLSAFADQFVFNWLRFQTDAPSNGRRLFSQLTYKPNKQLETYFRFRQRKRGRNDRADETIRSVVDEELNNYRLHFAYQISKNFQIKNRVELTQYQLGNGAIENGILIYQDLSYKKLSFPLSFSLRYALFDTDSYNSRIYAYESDVLYAFSIPAYSGIGSRFYIMTKYRIRRGVDLWLRYAQTYFTDRTEIGSGRELIEGNSRSELKAQLRVKF